MVLVEPERKHVQECDNNQRADQAGQEEPRDSEKRKAHAQGDANSQAGKSNDMNAENTARQTHQVWRQESIFIENIAVKDLPVEQIFTNPEVTKSVY